MHVTYACAVVGDGLSIGWPRCGIPHCVEPLQNNRHWFCASHQNHHDVCAIVGCNNPVLQTTVQDANGGPPKTVKKKTCVLSVPQKIESKHSERSTGSFYIHTNVVQPVDSFSQNTKSTPEQDLKEDFKSYTVTGNHIKGSMVTHHVAKNTGSIGTVDTPTDDCPSKLAVGNWTFKAHFGHQRTHNEQTLVRPCGIIFAHAMMYNAEAVSNFLIMLKNAFSVPGAQKPEHIMYNTNCLAWQQAENDPWFNGIGMCVNVWHFRSKHAASHKYCQCNCNPAMYPELMDPWKNWFFNTSVAEQTNAWLGGYNSMVQEMLPAKYEFFLDEMIRPCNKEVLQCLERQGHHPCIY
ncbi:hypothetical protein CVT25_012448 [Psilocybe cyanescens]|uniref:CxC6 like cysteine cluster associated with KDZ domain-containing protein n=1 Tax=Psilocybe cyanescens TaxID=93625 RepID=A0A409XC13_PSICY|nr:hypothetical protein CVT25_012448 [Psilocybe cyanescens]